MSLRNVLIAVTSLLPRILRTKLQYCQCRSGAGIAAIISDQVKKVYDCKQLKQAGINSDNLPLVIISSHICPYSSDIYVSLYGHAVYNLFIISEPNCQGFFLVHRDRVREVFFPKLWPVQQFLISRVYP